MAARKTAKKTARKPARTPKKVAESKGALKTMKSVTRTMPEISEMKMEVVSKKSSRKTFYILIALGVIVGVGYYFKSLFIAATVNGEPIARLSVIQEVEKQGGKQILETLINERLIMQEARTKGVNVTQEEVDAEIASIEDQVKTQGQTLDQVLALQGVSREEFDKQVKIQVIIKKLVADKISVTDEDISKYMEDNKDYLPEASDEAELKAQVKEQLTQQKISEEFQTLLTDLRTNAKVNYFVSY